MTATTRMTRPAPTSTPTTARKIGLRDKSSLTVLLTGVDPVKVTMVLIKKVLVTRVYVCACLLVCVCVCVCVRACSFVRVRVRLMIGANKC